MQKFIPAQPGNKFSPKLISALITLTFLSAVLLASDCAQAWGGRGHAAICESAVFLVKDNNLKEYLINKPHMMGHLCNVPDIHWKQLSSDLRRHGDAGHYINSENIGLAIKDMPLDLGVIIEKYTGQDNATKANSKIVSVPLEMGTNWWRADQFFRLAVSNGQDLKKLTPPSNSKEEQDDNLAFNKTFFEMIVNLGLLGHFVGDNGQPFHTTSDYDGWASGHGGIHAYYEDSVVGYFDGDLQARILKKARSMKSPKFLNGKNTIDKMRQLAELSQGDLKTILKDDPVMVPSTLKIEKGMSLKTYAKRRPAAEAYKKMQNLIVEEMARSSLLLAHLWDEAYKQAGSPEVTAYKSYRYPFTPDFIMPDYYDTKGEEKRSK